MVGEAMLRVLEMRRPGSLGQQGFKFVGAHPSAPTGQFKNAAPSRSAAGNSASLKTPAPSPALVIVTRSAKTIGLARAAH